MTNKKHFNSLIDPEEVAFYQNSRWYDHVLDYAAPVLVAIAVAIIVAEIVW